MGLFISFTIHAKQDMVIPIVENRALIVMPGLVHGLLSMSISRNNFPKPIDILQFDLTDVFASFSDSLGLRYRYYSVLSWSAFAPRIDTLCRHCKPGSFMGTTGEARPGIDPRGVLRARLAGGGEFVPAADHDRLWIISGKIDPVLGIYTKLATYNSAISKGGYGEGGTAIEYYLPIEHLLWRKAVSINGDMVVPEGQDYVDFRHMGLAKDLGIPLSPSSIKVVQAE